MKPALLERAMEKVTALHIFSLYMKYKNREMSKVLVLTSK
jgi:hypothetical protein